MKKQNPESEIKSEGWKNEIFKKKVRPVKSRIGKQGSIRSGGGKRN